MKTNTELVAALIAILNEEDWLLIAPTETETRTSFQHLSFARQEREIGESIILSIKLSTEVSRCCEKLHPVQFELHLDDKGTASVMPYFWEVTGQTH